jgi:hypothetical protein
MAIRLILAAMIELVAGDFGRPARFRISKRISIWQSQGNRPPLDCLAMVCAIASLAKGDGHGLRLPIERDLQLYRKPLDCGRIA